MSGRPVLTIWWMTPGRATNKSPGPTRCARSCTMNSPPPYSPPDRAGPPPATHPNPPPAAPVAHAAPPTAPAEHASAPAAAAAQGGEGSLNINSIPPSSVVLDGKPIGNTPQRGVSVSAGTHTVLFVNAEQGFKKQVSVTVAAGETKNVH